MAALYMEREGMEGEACEDESPHRRLVEDYKISFSRLNDNPSDPSSNFSKFQSLYRTGHQSTMSNGCSCWSRYTPRLR